MKLIYIYQTPDSKLLGLIKIGDANDVEKRISEQLNTASAFGSAYDVCINYHANTN
jgi:hypothetical protein